MKEVTLFSDDAKSKESAQQLGQVSFLWCNWIPFNSVFEGQNQIILCLHCTSFLMKP